MSSTFEYPGNAWLPQEVKERVVTTFRHSLELFRSGSFEEVSAGCELLLKMDPLFEPARRLSEALRDPGSVDLGALAALVGGQPQSGVAEARAALTARDFQRAIDIAGPLAASDAEAASIAQEASEKLEAAPFVAQFLSKARIAISAGDRAAAESALRKARTLDDSDPGVAEIDAELTASAPPTAASSFAFGGASSFDASSFAADAPGQSQGFDFGAGDVPSFEAPANDAGPSSSFVVEATADEPEAPAAPVSDFGFTFEEAPPSDSFAFVAPPAEEELPAGEAVAIPESGAFETEEQPEMSFDFGASSQPSGFEATPGEPNTFDFPTAAIETSAEDQAKIQRYLDEGDQAFSAGDYQKAIDIWSRIFLIDVTNDRASEKIEQARALRSDQDHKVEELMSGGVRAFDVGDLAGARVKFQEVLALDPANTAAADYLQRATTAAASQDIAPTRPSGSPGSAVLDDIDFEDGVAVEEILMPPDPPVAAAEPPPQPQPKKPEAAAGKKPLPMRAIAAAVGVVVLLGAGWLGYSKFFGAGAGAGTQESQTTIAQAQQLVARGQYDRAIALLASIAPDDPNHNQALSLIDEFKKKKTAASAMIGGRPATEVFDDWISKARTALESRDYLAAKQAFEEASKIQPLPADLKPQMDLVVQQVGKLEAALTLFKEGNYPAAISNLESVLQQEPDNPNAMQLLANAHYNLGVTALQEERTQEAIDAFAKVLETNPNDLMAKRSRDLAIRYDGQPRDLLYAIYVKYLTMR